MPPEMTKHVATVRHKLSLWVKSQMAKMQETTEIMMHNVMVKNERAFTLAGLINPLRLELIGGGLLVTVFIII